MTLVVSDYLNGDVVLTTVTILGVIVFAVLCCIANRIADKYRKEALSKVFNDECADDCYCDCNDDGQDDPDEFDDTEVVCR